MAKLLSTRSSSIQRSTYHSRNMYYRLSLFLVIQGPSNSQCRSSCQFCYHSLCHHSLNATKSSLSLSFVSLMPTFFSVANPCGFIQDGIITISLDFHLFLSSTLISPALDNCSSPPFLLLFHSSFYTLLHSYFLLLSLICS